MAGFSFVERLAGTFYFLAEPMIDRPIRLELEAHVRSVRTPIGSVTGRIHAEGLAEAVVQGTLGLHRLDARRIPYDVAFIGERAGRPCRFALRGEKDLSWLAPIKTLVEMHFTIGTDADGAWTEIARGTMRSDPRDWRAVARSLRASPF